MKYHQRIITSFLCVVFGTIPFLTSAYDIDTHAFLASEATDFYNANFNEKISDELKPFLIDGARREDDVPRWMNHFYDPANDRGLSYDMKIDPAINVGDWQKSKEWANDGENQNDLKYKVPSTVASILTAIQRGKISEISTETEFTWNKAIEYYVREDYEKAFFSLGHIIHLIQDLSVPAHTRNDPHPEGDPYEEYAEKYTLSNKDNALVGRLKGKMPTIFGTLGEYFDEIATYSNNNFLSQDTIGIQAGYVSPEFDFTEEKKLGEYFVGKGRDESGSFNLYLKKSGPFSNLVINEKDIALSYEIENGDVVLKDYWSRLSTKSVQYSAGIIDLFLNEAKKAKEDPEYLARKDNKTIFGQIVSSIGGGIRNLISKIGGGNSTGDNDPNNPPENQKEDDGEDEENKEPDNSETDENTEENGVGGFPDGDNPTEDGEEKTPEDEEDKDVEDKGSQTENETIFCKYDAVNEIQNKQIIINEIAWMGTNASFADEWFELKNISQYTIDIRGWQILDEDREIKIVIATSTIIKPNEFYLFERTDDESVLNISADAIYSGNLSNDGTKKTESLTLFNKECKVMDRALAVPWWSGGDNKEKRTMERNGSSLEWHTSSVIGGTPKAENSSPFVAVSGGGGATQSETATSPKIRINEIFYDAEGSDDGKEWIEIKNEDTVSADLTGWKFYENDTHHSLQLVSGDFNIGAGGFAIIAEDENVFMSVYPDFSGNLFSSAFSLSNAGERIAIKNDDVDVDSIEYSTSTGANGDGDSLQKIEGIWRAVPPTPGRENEIPNELPVADFSILPSEPIAGQTVNFESLSYDSDGSLASINWNFGDGITESGASSSITHAYLVEGIYEASITVMDNEGASATKTIQIIVYSASFRAEPVTHIVISEILFDADGPDDGKEFVEIYNPAEVEQDLLKWTLQYYVGDSTSSMPLATFGGVTEDKKIIPPHGFLLVGFNNYNSDNFSGVNADILRNKSLPNGDERISLSIETSAGNEIDKIRYTENSISEQGESFERKTVFDGACTSAQNDGEYNGHLCDRGSDTDLESRNIPHPQNSFSLPEPREKPSDVTPISGETNIVKFDKTSMNLIFSWNASSAIGYNGEIVYTIKDLSDGYLALPDIHTTSTTFSIKIKEVGRKYSFSAYAEDSDGLKSNQTNFEIFVPTFLSDVFVYKDTRSGNENYYVIDMEWREDVPIPQIYGTGPNALVFYGNRTANASNTTLSWPEYAPTNMDGVHRVSYKTCGSYPNFGASYPALRFSPNGGDCPQSGPDSTGLSSVEIEDRHMIIRIASSTSAFALSSSDYVSIGYYGMNAYGHFELVAIDTNKYFFRETLPQQYPPVLSGELSVSFNEALSKITLSLPTKTDEDSIDADTFYELNFSTSSESGTLDDALWNIQTKESSYEKAVAPSDKFLIGVRAKDDFGNVSSVATTTWEYPSTIFYIEQVGEDDWRPIMGFGMVNPYDSKPNSASFQSFVPENSFEFNTVVVKLQQYLVSDRGDIRISVLGNAETDSPDFQNVIGEAYINRLYNPSGEQTFFFESPVSVNAGQKYWLVLDLAGYSSPAGFERNTWKNAVSTGGSGYANGVAGFGFFRGNMPACVPDSVNCEFTPDGRYDWYMKIGKRAQ